jgi:hypothetical protein
LNAQFANATSVWCWVTAPKPEAQIRRWDQEAMEFEGYGGRRATCSEMAGRADSVHCKPPQPLTDLRDYRRSPQFQNHWIVAVSGLKFFRETSFALSFSCLLIAGGKTRSATRLLARRLVFSNAEP